MGGRGKEGEPIDWTGWVCAVKCEAEANPGFLCMTRAASGRFVRGSHRPLGRQEKPLARVVSARTANRHR